MTDAAFYDYSKDPQTSNGEVRIGEHYYPVVGGQVTTINLDRWPPKVTFGDYSQDSDPLVSSWILSSFQGGIGNFKIKSGVEDDTYWTGTLETRFPDGLTLLPQTQVFNIKGNDGSAYPLGDFPASDPTLLVAFGTALYHWDESTLAFIAAPNDLSYLPVYSGVEFDDKFYVPHGGNGYSIIDVAGTVTAMTDVEPIHMIVWDRKLVALTADGLITWKAVGGTWSADVPDRHLPSGALPRKLVNFMDASGAPTLHVVTNTAVFAFDPDAGTDGVLYETRLDYPRHPDQGLGATNWRGDTMFTSVGLGIHGYTGNLITSMGPDGRFSLPSHLRGKIVDLAAEYNALLALIEGTPSVNQDPIPEAYQVKPTMYQGSYNYKIPNFQYKPVYSSLYRWSNSQWHPVWESPVASGTPNWMVISEADNAYRLWWGYGKDACTQILPRAYQNPKQSLLSGSIRFQSSGSLITGWFDADMVAFSKLASHIEVNLDDVLGLNEPGGRVVVSYEVDNDAEQAWRTLGEASTVGTTVMTFRNVVRELGAPFSRGRSFRRIRFKIDMYQKEGRPELSPLVESIVFKFQKIPQSQKSWQFSVNLTTEGGYKNVGNDTLAQYLIDQLSSGEFFEFGLRGKVYRARAAQAQNSGMTGYDERGNYGVNVVEVVHGRPEYPRETVDA